MANEKNEQAKNTMIQYMNNPKAFTLKKWFIELLGNRYTNHDPIIERVSMSLSTDNDTKEFGSMIAEVFEAGYFRAVNDYKEQAKNAGMDVKVIIPKKNQD